jgi:hypothetical protein
MYDSIITMTYSKMLKSTWSIALFVILRDECFIFFAPYLSGPPRTPIRFVYFM